MSANKVYIGRLVLPMTFKNKIRSNYVVAFYITDFQILLIL